MYFFNLLSSFCGWVGISGLKLIYQAQNVKLKAFWCLLFIGSVIMCFIHSKFIVDNYFKYGKKTALKLEFRSRPFPAVTLCNLNPYKKNALAGSPRLQSLMSSYSYVKQKAAATTAKSRKKRQADPAFVATTTTTTTAGYQCINNSTCLYNGNPTDTYTMRLSENNVLKICFRACDDYIYGACIKMMMNSRYFCKHFHERLAQFFFVCVEPEICSDFCKSPTFDNGTCAANMQTCTEDFVWGNSCAPEIPKFADTACSLEHSLPTCVPPTTSPRPRIEPGQNIDEVPLPLEFEFEDLTHEEKKVFEETVNETFKIAVEEKSEDPLSIQADVVEALMETSVIMTDEQRIGAAYSLEDMVFTCSINTHPCDLAEDFEAVLDPNYGQCFTFHYQSPTPKYYTERPGPNTGLQVIMFSNISEYLSTTQQAGVRVVVHPQGTAPIPGNKGFNAGVGSAVLLSIQYRETHRLPEPYGDCRSSEEKVDRKEFFYPKNYTIEGCFRSCIQRRIKEKCGCGDPRFPLGGDDDQYCVRQNEAQYNCMHNYITSGGDTVEDCTNCPDACEEAEYKTLYTKTKWPATDDVFMAPKCADMGLRTSEACAKLYRENAVLIKVYYERLNYVRVDEQAVYTVCELLRNVEEGIRKILVDCNYLESYKTH